MDIGLHLTRKDKIIGLVVTSGGILLAAIGWFLMGPVALNLVLLLFGVGLFLLILDTRRRSSKEIQINRETIERNTKNFYEQTEALLAIQISSISGQLPLPKTRGFAASPDFLHYLSLLIYEHQPTCILEAGSGVSTMVAAACLQGNGHGEIISLEHDEAYAQQTRRQLRARDGDTVSNVLHAPLVKYDLDDRESLWYDVDPSELPAIDLLIIDGPPRRLHPWARYAALPLLWKNLRPGGLILMDDGRREHERRIVSSWAQHYPITSQYLSFERGAYLVTKQHQTP